MTTNPLDKLRELVGGALSTLPEHERGAIRRILDKETATSSDITGAVVEHAKSLYEKPVGALTDEERALLDATSISW